MKASDLCISLIRRFEGLRLQVYRDAAGYLTAGYGRLLPKGTLLHEYEAITLTDAEWWLQEDIATAERRAERAAALPLDQYQVDALVSFCFNLGAPRPGSALLRLLREGPLEDVPRVLRLYVKAAGRVLPGLVKRREVEAHLWDLPRHLTIVKLGLQTRYGLSRDGYKALQALLFMAGHDPGAIDGAPGPKTKAAVDALHVASGSEPCGRMCLDLVEELEAVLDAAGSPRP
jgi:lysozyme